jgi:hypothetical protein
MTPIPEPAGKPVPRTRAAYSRDRKAWRASFALPSAPVPGSPRWTGCAAAARRGCTGSGADLFEASHTYLDGLGVRVPRVYLLDRSRAGYPADIALVEDVPGASLETQLERSLPGADQALAQPGAAVSVMHQQRGASFGKLAYILGGAAGQGDSAEDDSIAGQDGAAQDGTAPRRVGARFPGAPLR